MEPKSLDISMQPGLEPSAEAMPLQNSTHISENAILSQFPPFMAIKPGEGVNTLKPTQFIVGIVSVKESVSPKENRSFWLLRYIDPDSGADVRRRISGLSKDEVKGIAEHLTRQAYQGKGYLAAKVKVPTLKEGIEAAIRLSRARDEGKADMAKKSAYFLNFMERNYKQISTWADIKPSMAESFIRSCERLGLAYDTIRLRLVAVKAAWRQMHADYPDQVKALPSLRLRTPRKKDIDCLTFEEVKALLEWLKVNAPTVYPIQCLAALCGLRQREAAALREKDIDFQKGTITICDTASHEVKTRYSERTIPVAPVVMNALRDAIRCQKVKPIGGGIFTNRYGNPWESERLTGRMMEVMDKAAIALENPRYGQIPARKLRAAFATELGRAGADDRLLKAYIGHSPADILGTHYRQIKVDELQSVCDRVQALYDKNAWQESGNIATHEAVNA